MTKWTDIKKELFASSPICKFCKIRPAVHLHHAIINKGKLRNKRLHKYLDHKYNALEVCGECHKFADSWKFRVKAYRINSKRYGKANMDAWYYELPLKVKERMG